jgi:hypothetical protein
MLNSQVTSLVGGGIDGQPLFITNYEEFLVSRPRQQADLFMVDFFQNSTRGKFSSANYVGAGDIRGIVGNFPGYLVAQARQMTIDQAKAPGAAGCYDLDEYAANPDVMFETGNWRAFNAFMTNPCNNPFGYITTAQDVYNQKLLAEFRVAEVKAQSSGFLPAEKNGYVTAPAASIQEAVTNVQNLGNTIIATAQNPWHLVGGVVSAYANRIVTGLIRQGFSTAQAAVQKQISEVDQKINQALGPAITQVGSAAGYINSTAPQIDRALRQSQNARVRLNTPAPPGALPQE